MTSIFKSVYIDKLDNIVNQWIAHVIEPLKWAYIDFNVEKNDSNSKFTLGGHIMTSKYKNIFGK